MCDGACPHRGGARHRHPQVCRRLFPRSAVFPSRPHAKAPGTGLISADRFRQCAPFSFVAMRVNFGLGDFCRLAVAGVLESARQQLAPARSCMLLLAVLLSAISDVAQDQPCSSAKHVQNNIFRFRVAEQPRHSVVGRAPLRVLPREWCVTLRTASAHRSCNRKHRPGAVGDGLLVGRPRCDCSTQRRRHQEGLACRLR